MKGMKTRPLFGAAFKVVEKITSAGGSEKTARKIASIGFRSAFLRNASQFAVSLGKLG